MEPSIEWSTLDDEVEVERRSQNLVERSDDQLVLADSDTPHR
jgi:hypothetical protein